MGYGWNCQHEFIDVKTRSPVAALVNVLAAAGTPGCMTLGRKYRCERCDRIIDLRHRGRLALPETPVDSRTVDPAVFADAPDTEALEPVATATAPSQAPQHAARA